VCAGSGIAALIAAPNATHAWAADLTERSTHFARFNAQLNGFDNFTNGVASDCGAEQPTYIFGSMPGLGTTATFTDGTPMHNWWVYLFY